MKNKVGIRKVMVKSEMYEKKFEQAKILNKSFQKVLTVENDPKKRGSIQGVCIKGHSLCMVEVLKINTGKIESEEGQKP